MGHKALAAKRKLGAANGQERPVCAKQSYNSFQLDAALRTCRQEWRHVLVTSDSMFVLASKL